MAVTLIYDPKRTATNLVQYTTDKQTGKRKYTQIGSIAASARFAYNRSKKVAEVRTGNKEIKTADCKTDLTEVYITEELRRFYENILTREYVVKIQSYDYRYISDEKKREIESALGLTADDMTKIYNEQARLSKIWKQSLSRVFAKGFLLNANDSKSKVYTKDLVSVIRTLEKQGGV